MTLRVKQLWKAFNAHQESVLVDLANKYTCVITQQMCRSHGGCALAPFCFWSVAAADRSHFFVRGRPQRSVSLQTEGRGNTSRQTRWARQLTGQTGAATAIFCGDARVRQISAGDGHESSAIAPADAVMLKECFSSRDGCRRRSRPLPRFVLRCLQMGGTQFQIAGDPSGWQRWALKLT